MASVILLGPQRRQPTIQSVIEGLGVRGPFALITAGWQERELEDDELSDAIGGNSFNLGLYQRCEKLYEEDPELARAIGRRQDKLRQLQALYRLRLAGTMQGARDLLQREGDPELLEPERDFAIEALRQLDRHHLSRVAEIHRAFELSIRPGERRALARARDDIFQRLHDAAAVLVAGGHVAVLLNRMRLFAIDTVLRLKPVFAWSAGAMVVSSRIVLFHDTPVHGQGNAELLDRGLALCRGVLPLPHASSRLQLDDINRVALFARRFNHLTPVVMDPGARLDWDAPHWRPGPETWTLSRSGALKTWSVA